MDAYSSTVDRWQRCAMWRVMGAARTNGFERCCDSAANTSATAARVLNGMFDLLKDKDALEPGGCCLSDNHCIQDFRSNVLW